jgi:septum formation protein
MADLRLILASGSRFRRAMLDAAGVVFEVVPAEVDEPALRAKLAVAQPSLSPAGVAAALAEAKAAEVSARFPASLVIGPDQVLDFEGDIFGKPENTAMARTHLLRLRGKMHALHSAAVLLRGGMPVWSTVGSVQMHMRAFSDAFLESYLVSCGDDVCHTAGAYALEGLGGQLFDRVEGDYFAVIGLPLLPLLAALRVEGLL